MPKRRDKTPAPKQVVYLWGAGATQAEISYLGARNLNLLMRDSNELGHGVATRILKHLPKRWQPSFSADCETDIEKLISLLAASNVDTYHNLAENIRKLYFEDIRKTLTTAKVLSNPKLAVALLTLHRHDRFRQREELSQDYHDKSRWPASVGRPESLPDGGYRHSVFLRRLHCERSHATTGAPASRVVHMDIRCAYQGITASDGIYVFTRHRVDTTIDCKGI